MHRLSTFWLAPASQEVLNAFKSFPWQKRAGKTWFCRCCEAQHETQKVRMHAAEQYSGQQYCGQLPIATAVSSCNPQSSGNKQIGRAQVLLALLRVVATLRAAWMEIYSLCHMSLPVRNAFPTKSWLATAESIWGQKWDRSPSIRILFQLRQEPWGSALTQVLQRTQTREGSRSERVSRMGLKVHSVFGCSAASSCCKARFLATTIHRASSGSSGHIAGVRDKSCEGRTVCFSEQPPKVAGRCWKKETLQDVGRLRNLFLGRPCPGIAQTANGVFSRAISDSLAFFVGALRLSTFGLSRPICAKLRYGIPRSGLSDVSSQTNWLGNLIWDSQ